MATLRAVWLVLIVSLLVASGCARLNQELAAVETPRISVAGVKVLPLTGTEQRIELVLRVMNPNNFDLEARGLVVEIGFNDIPVLNGVSSSIPVVPAYSEALVTVTVSASIVNGLRLLATLAEHPDDPLQYRLEARLDMKRYLGKRIVILHQGEISARPAGSVQSSGNAS